MSLYNLKKNCCNVPRFIHFEVTQRCPLKCPQCYCDLSLEEDMEWITCEKLVEEAGQLGVEEILITGGEPLLYPRLIDLVSLIRKLKMKSVIATSGLGLTNELIMQLKNAGINKIFVSLNGSKKEIHNLSRGKFEDGVKAIENIKNSGVWCGINWVARKDNIDDFLDLIELAKTMKVNQVAILSHKNCKENTKSILDIEQLMLLAENIRELRKKDYISIELCYQELNYCLLGEKMHPILRSCVAGRYFMDISVNGEFSPCRHLLNYEKCDSISDYWANSQVLYKFRNQKNYHINNCRSIKSEGN